MRLQDVLTAHEVRALHWSIYRDPRFEYDLSDPHVERRIKNVQDSRIRRNLAAVTDFDLPTLESAWACHMAIWSGTHVWPDGNHRTGLYSFNRALSKTFRLHLIPENEDASKRMVMESKAMRQAAALTRRRYYTLEELRDASHPYRMLFARHAARLRRIDPNSLAASLGFW